MPIDGARTVSRFDFQYRGGVVFALKSSPPKNQPILVVLRVTLDVAKERALLDLNEVDPSGRTAIDFFKPSHDGKHIALSLSKNGTEEGTAYVIEVATGKRLKDEVPRVHYPTAGGSVEWAADGRGFYYTRYPSANERPEADRHFYQTVWFHALGTPVSSDRYVIGREFPRIAEIALRGGAKGRVLLAEVRNGDGGEIAYFLRRGKMAAQLQATSASCYPVLLRSDADSGHSVGNPLSKRIDQETDTYSFLFDQLSIKGPPRARHE